jgi:transcriptional regulator with XRE-family HTH domain
VRSKKTSELDGIIAKSVRMERMRRGMSQTDLGSQLGVSFQQIQKYEKGVNRISAGRIFQIATLFDVPIQALFPDATTPDDVTKPAPQHMGEFAELLATADCVRLCRAFLQIKDVQTRKKIVALVESIPSGDSALPSEDQLDVK